MKTCKFCNRQNSDNAKFCIACGAPFENLEKKQKSKKVMLSVLAVIAVLMIILVIIGLKHAPVLSIPKNKEIVMDYLEQKYPNEAFEIKSVDGVYGDYEVFEPLLHITDEWECHVVSDKTGDENFIVKISTDGQILGDNYYTIKYKNEVNDILKRVFDSVFMEGNYVFTFYFDAYYFDDSIMDAGANCYIEQGVLDTVWLIVSSDFDSSDEAKICNDIEKYFDAQFTFYDDSAYAYSGIEIYFDKDDAVESPAEFDWQYFGMKYWEKHLSFSVPEYDWKWKYNTEANVEFKTAAPFLNGKVPVISIDGYTFTLGETTPNDIRKNTKYNKMDGILNNTELDCGETGDVILYTSGYHNELLCSIENDTSKKEKKLNCMIYEITLGDWTEYAHYENCSFDGLSIGDIVDEEMLIEHFGEYETINRNILDGNTYRFIDGTASDYDNAGMYPKQYLDIALTADNRICYIVYHVENSDSIVH